ncbi:hypothetical protein RF11_11935 [Thelohanellus kitauei]|uniref:MD-2-related lipid-recognition domain-containing protein n=1 Tax=Thelohanellus kitauei TaxID=669202 RepID=A0A0C2IL32_THEKT|nr:hypothetical protein RF11_11935 [Thelohanellus kitauei]
MGIKNIHVYTLLAIFVNILKISHEQVFICAKRIDDSPYYIKSVSVTGCNKGECRYLGYDHQTFNVTFISFLNSDTAKAITKMRWPGLNERDHWIGDYDLCELNILPCPIYYGAEYNVALRFAVPNNSGGRDIWTTMTIEGDNRKIFSCVKALFRKDEGEPYIPRA